MTARHAGTRRKGVPGAPGAQCLGLLEGSGKRGRRVQWTQEPHRALATAGVAEEAGWGEGGTA